MKKHAEAGSALYTHFLLSYEGLAGQYAHKVVNHAVEYVNGRINTNGVENFRSLLKRNMHGAYISVEPFHLFRYLDEQTFRYNNRKNVNDQAHFEMAMSNVSAIVLPTPRLQEPRLHTDKRQGRGKHNASPCWTPLSVWLGAA